LKVFSHHVYEYRKGLRNLVLHTTRAEHRPQVEARLAKHEIDYVVYALGNERINIFFGAFECVEVVRRIGKPRLADYTPEEDFMLGTMLGYDRLAQCRRYLIQHERRQAPALPAGRHPGVWRMPPAVHAGFTLIELLIVIGLLGAVASLLLASFSGDREKMLDDSVVQAELSDIQRAFQRMNGDCVLQQEDYRTVARYGFAVLLREGSGSFAKWDAEKNKGWRGPYIAEESTRLIDVGSDSSPHWGQRPLEGGYDIPVICTPYAQGANDGSFYRVIRQVDTDGAIVQLWAVFPTSGGVLPAEIEDGIENESELTPYAHRRLLMRD
jgi:prepilin-type N-terminal cleavage/methylation domain-containing protein